MANYNSPAAAHKPAHGGYPDPDAYLYENSALGKTTGETAQVQQPKTGGPLTQEFGVTKVAALLAVLLGLRASVEDGTIRYYHALCWSLDDALEDAGEKPSAFVGIRDYLYRKWPDFSGSIAFPVPGRGTDDEDEAVADHWMRRYSDGEELDFDDPGDVADAYYNSVDDGILHDCNFWIGAYGEKRKQLLQFMIDELTKEATQ